MLKRIQIRELGPYAALLILLIAGCLTSEAFRNPQNLINITRQVSYTGLIALGMTFVIAAGGIDLSVGSLLAFSGTLALLGMNRFPEHEMLGILTAGAVALGVGALGGAANGLFISVWKIPPFIVTLGTLSIFRSLTLYMADAGLTSTQNGMYCEFGSMELLLPLPTWVLIGFTFFLAFVLSKTKFGRHTCAVGSNEKVAFYSGIATGRIKFMTYLLAGVLTGLSAFLFAGRLGSLSSSTAGLSYELDAIAAVIIGGTAMSGGRATIWGTLAGILILGIVSNLLNMWEVPVCLEGTVKGAVIIVAVLLQRKKNQ